MLRDLFQSAPRSYPRGDKSVQSFAPIARSFNPRPGVTPGAISSWLRGNQEHPVSIRAPELPPGRCNEYARMAGGHRVSIRAPELPPGR